MVKTHTKEKSDTNWKMKVWLTENKIFFEVFQYFILWIAWILIWAMQLCTGLKEYSLDQIKMQPIIKIYTELSKNDLTWIFETEQLKIRNEWESLHDFSSDITTFYEISYWTGKLNIPVKGFFAAKFSSNNYKWELLTALDPQNNSRYHKLYMSLLSLSKDNYGYIFIKNFTIVRVSFLDIRNTYKESYFYVDTWLWYEIDKSEYLKYKEGEKLFESKYWIYDYTEVDTDTVLKFINNLQ